MAGGRRLTPTGTCAAFPQRLREASERAGLSIRALAIRAQVHPRSITGWRAGASMPGIDMVERLALALGTTAAWLAYGV